jgi:hypothetical protein
LRIVGTIQPFQLFLKCFFFRASTLHCLI